MIQTPLKELLFYVRIILFPLCALGFVTSAIYEYQYGKSKLRLAIMLMVALTMLVWMSLTIAAVSNPTVLDAIKLFAATPVIAILTAMIWIYAIARTKVMSRTKYNNHDKKGGRNGEEDLVK